MKIKSKKISALILAGFITIGSFGIIPVMSNAQSTSTSVTRAVTKTQTGTTTVSVKMRSKSSTKGKALATLKKGTKVEVIKKESNGWYKIKYKTKTGYVSGKYLKVTTTNSSSTATKTQTGTIATSVKMRSKSSTKGKVLATLKKGSKVEVIKKESNGWYKIKYKTKTGYVSGKYIKVTATNNNSNSVSNIDWSKKYPNLINPDKKDIKSVAFSSKVTIKLDGYIKTLDKLEKNFNANELQKLFNDIFELNKTISVKDVSLHKDYDQIDYIMYKITYIAFTNLKEGTQRNKFFSKLADDMYLSSIRRFNSGFNSKLMKEYGAYWGFTLAEYFNDKETGKTLFNLAGMIISVASLDATGGRVISEKELPSNVKPDPSPSLQ